LILLDTNVISELLRPNGSEDARRWLDAQPTRSVYICTPVIGELRYGLELLKPSARRTRLERAYARLASELFADRILGFDRVAADHFGRLRAARRKAGKPIDAMDALIAAIAAANTMTLATRNIRDFGDLGLPLVNPFDIP
jgi:toxin FitB